MDKHVLTFTRREGNCMPLTKGQDFFSQGRSWEYRSKERKKMEGEKIDLVERVLIR